MLRRVSSSPPSPIAQGGLRCPGMGAAGKVLTRAHCCPEHLVGFRQHLPTARQGWAELARPSRQEEPTLRAELGMEGTGEAETTRDTARRRARGEGEGGQGGLSPCHHPRATSSLQAGCPMPVGPCRAALCPSPQTCGSIPCSFCLCCGCTERGKPREQRNKWLRASSA